MGDRAPIAPTFFVRLEQEARAELGDEGQRHEVRAIVRRGEAGYRVHIRHVANEIVSIDGEVAVQPGTPARVGASDAIVQLDLATEEELRAKGQGGVDLTTEAGCRSI